MFKTILAIVMVPAFVLPNLVLLADDDEEPKFTNKQVMELAHKGRPSLLRKVMGGDANEEEKKKLVDLYVAMSKNKPKKGDEKSWKEKCEALIKAAKAFVGGDENAKQDLRKASNCMGCHRDHK